MSILSSGSASVGETRGIASDPLNSRDKGANLNFPAEDYDDLTQLTDALHHGDATGGQPDTGLVGDYDGAASTGHPRAVVRAIVHEDVVADYWQEDVETGGIENRSYRLEAAVPIPGTSYHLGWIGSFQEDGERAEAADWRTQETEIIEALSSGPETGGLPRNHDSGGLRDIDEHPAPGPDPQIPHHSLSPEYGQEYWDGQVAQDGDDERIYNLMVDAFDDNYCVPIDQDFVSWMAEDPLVSVIRGEEGEIVSTAAAEPVRIPDTAVGTLEMVEVSEVVTSPAEEHRGQGLATVNVQALREPLQEYAAGSENPVIIYSQNTAAVPGMSAVAARNGGIYGGVLEGHANVANDNQDLILTWYPWGRTNDSQE